MPAHLQAQPKVDDPIDVWRAWWNARNEWRKATGAPNVVGAWIRDVSTLMELHNARWITNGRALSQAVQDTDNEGTRW